MAIVNDILDEHVKTRMSTVVDDRLGLNFLDNSDGGVTVIGK